MPFTSKAQARKLFATNPAVAKEFAAATPSIKALPERSKGAALERARKRSTRKRRRRRGGMMSGPMNAGGQTVTGGSTSTTRSGY